MRQARRSDQTKRDIVEVADYLALDNLDIALRFLDSVEAALSFLSDNPQAGVRRRSADPALGEIRMWRIPRFERYLIFYREADAFIEIIRILHGARHIEGILDDLTIEG